MNISSGVSEISALNIAGGAQKIEKIYTWPALSKKPVQAVKPVTSGTENTPFYIKPSETDKKQLLEKLHSASEMSYNALGRGMKQTELLKPGSFFEALA